MKRFLPFISFLLTLQCCLLTLYGWYSPLFILSWVISVIFLILPHISFTHLPTIKIPTFRKSVLLICTLALPLLVRIINSDLTRIHQDEALLAFFTLHHSYQTLNFFSGIPHEIMEWQSQYPTPFFVIQKIFFILFGANLLTIKLSILPYIFIIAVMLYKIVKEISGIRPALISLIFYAFLANSIYFETLGTINNTGPAVFLPFLYFLILFLKKNKKRDAILSGILCAFCYLFYISAYIAFPILLFGGFLTYIRFKRLFFKNFLFALFAFLVTLAPFLTYAIRYDNYFTQRINQVSLLTGSLSKERLSLGKNILMGFESFTTDAIGGSDGFDFGHLALFERFTRILLIISFLAAIFFSFSHPEFLLILFSIFLSFLTMALSVSPPGYHRLILFYPLSAIILSVPFYYFFKLQIHPVVRFAIPFIIFSVFIRNNYAYFQKAVKPEKNNEDLRLSELINISYPNRHLYIAAFPGVAFEKIYFFSPHKNAAEVKADYHKSLLKNFNPDIKYVYVITYPKSFDPAFIEKDPKGKLVKFSQNYDLFVN